MAKNILLVAGGDSSEHDISLISVKYVAEKLQANPEFNVISCVLHNNQFCLDDGSIGYFSIKNHFICEKDNKVTQEFDIDCAVPCLHGFPGETGDIQAFFTMQQVPFIGCKQEASLNCFNKVTTKLYLSALNIENSPYIFISNNDEVSLKQAHEAFHNFQQDVYVKAASQGSSIGCYHVTNEAELDEAIHKALTFSTLVLIEQTIEHRELEVAAFEYQGKLHITKPGEIIIPDDLFYTFEEKYSTESSSKTVVDVECLSPLQLEMMQSMATRAFKGLGLRHLSRIDFFLANDGVLYINEINTFPGMTPISMFPKLVEHYGVSMQDFFRDCVVSAIKEQCAA